MRRPIRGEQYRLHDNETTASVDVVTVLEVELNHALIEQSDGMRRWIPIGWFHQAHASHMPGW